ncbi:iron complex transport system permease protein [Methanosarcina thermophila]|uniref:Cobalamin import system permease protein BtuC n=3 Tax=Methanosarcina thermophila TaxID=2210 RepID=A0A1I7B8P7_METTE|nr:iron ABC transporter permease [Methanosarcina thermophila]ALK04458.1 MAG: iron ABC transporter permease [Methanosarcina sp. 795]AKB13097.1 Iron(III) dicitrate transport system permease protein [Methanosarcina thermophila TM-1]AKB16271.1 Iron(III) dicitrate transport system permease protein [Methanosarcina thermophila CHTI-55]NLU58175.1 iron ABC transporter permease [Methanosarcina thermophila]SFT83511.1 iron complex transport system permease protein [Methanosarcina thermophila]
MHFASGAVPEDYLAYVRRKYFWIMGGLLLLFFMLVYSISVGAVEIPFYKVVQTLLGQEPITKSDENIWRIVWNIRLPQALAAIVAGAGLSVAGVVMQSILRNPIASPFTLGVSNAGAFGAAVSVVVLGTGKMQSTVADAVIINNPYMTTTVAFLFCLLATGVILLISKIRGTSPEVMVLAGVALSSLFTAGTMFLQYFADDTQLAAVVFWTFGDVGRVNWVELEIMTSVVLLAILFFIVNCWNYNAIDAGDETAKGLGVNVERIRLTSMVISALVSAVIVAFLGVIGFIGLICPHMVRRVIGDDQKYLIPGSALFGGILLLVSDTAARLIISPYVLPVSVLTAFMGAPAFIYLLLRGYKR